MSVTPPAGPVWPITGTDVAYAVGLPSSSAEMDTAALTACQLVGEYLDRDKVDALDDLPSPIREACLVVAIDIWQNRTAVGGQPVGMDFTPSPYRMGRTLLDRVTGLLGPWMEQSGDLS